MWKWVYSNKKCLSLNIFFFCLVFFVLIIIFQVFSLFSHNYCCTPKKITKKLIFNFFDENQIFILFWWFCWFNLFLIFILFASMFSFFVVELNYSKTQNNKNSEFFRDYWRFGKNIFLKWLLQELTKNTSHSLRCSFQTDYENDGTWLCIVCVRCTQSLSSVRFTFVYATIAYIYMHAQYTLTMGIECVACVHAFRSRQTVLCTYIYVGPTVCNECMHIC